MPRSVPDESRPRSPTAQCNDHALHRAKHTTKGTVGRTSQRGHMVGSSVLLAHFLSSITSLRGICLKHYRGKESMHT